MKVVDSLIRKEADNKLSFGNYELTEKTKLPDFEYQGDLYKIKTYNEITKLEKNGMFVYESVPGSSVFDFDANENVTEFKVTGKQDIQITLELEADTEYEVSVGDVCLGRMKTNLGGKLIFSVEAQEDKETPVKIIKS